jgi:DNA-binding protein H-NS
LGAGAVAVANVVCASQYFDMQNNCSLSAVRLLRMMLAFGIKSWMGAIMKRSDFEILSTEELWVLHQKVVAKLKAKIIAEKKVLEDRLSQLNGRLRVEQTGETRERRSYPTVFPKFRNPEQPSKNLGGSREEARLAERTA